MNITRRDALRGAAAVAATSAVPIAALARETAADPLREGVQALVREIREDLPGSIITGANWALQEVADRLEALSGIEAVPNQHWAIWRQDFDRRFGPTRNLRPGTEAV